MANSGWTTTSALSDSLDVVVSGARLVREFGGVMNKLVDPVTLGEGIGLSWTEVSYAQLVALAITETTENDNPQQMSDTPFSITPTMVQIHTFITDRVAARITKKGYGKLGSLAQNAIERKKDEDGLVVLDGATTSLAGAGNILTSGHIRAATKRITSNTTEPAVGPIHCVLHGFQIKDIEDEIVSGLGTYPIADGLTADVFKNNFSGVVGTAKVFEDGNITIDGSDDAKGGVFAREGIVKVQGKALRTEPRREPQRGGGGTSLWITDEYAYGERSAGNWVYEIYSDALAPTA